MQYENLVADTLKEVSDAIARHPTQYKVFFNIFIGNDGGMAPDVAIEIVGNKYKYGDVPNSRIEVWRSASDKYAATIIFLGVIFKDNDFELLSESGNIESIVELATYLDKAIQIFNLNNESE